MDHYSRVHNVNKFTDGKDEHIAPYFLRPHPNSVSIIYISKQHAIFSNLSVYANSGCIKKIHYFDKKNSRIKEYMGM
jgi:ABC-type lipopolysaccharide export system ATPase subunit